MPSMSPYLDLVALGSVADVVPLDYLNRLLIHQGIKRIRQKKTCAGILALCEVGGRDPATLSTTDLAFFIAPRLNAAGRLEDMKLGIECLLTDDPVQAKQFATQLNTLNIERKAIEETMKEEAFKSLDAISFQDSTLPYGICLYHPQWHQGVIGIVAGRLKEKHHRPTIIFASSDNGYLKGSARSIPGIHIRDTLDFIAKKHPNLIQKFGGHAMAAGLQILPEQLEPFKKIFNDTIATQDAELFLQKTFTDGYLEDRDISLTTITLLDSAGPFGQHFPAPLFEGTFTIIEQRIVGENHLKLSLQQFPEGKILDGIFFRVDLNHFPNHRAERARVLYTLSLNEFNGLKKVQLMVQQLVYL
jgi:single-stranded-DNA-specific exonuclease